MVGSASPNLQASAIASVRKSFTLDDTLLGRARQLDIDIDIPAAARNGVAAAVRAALATADRAAYERNPERPDPFWNDAQAWGET